MGSIDKALGAYVPLRYKEIVKSLDDMNHHMNRGIKNKARFAGRKKKRGRR